MSKPSISFGYYLRMFIGVAYIIMGLVFLMTEAGEKLVGNKMLGLAFGGLLAIYGAFRFYRNHKKWDTPSE